MQIWVFQQSGCFLLWKCKHNWSDTPSPWRKGQKTLPHYQINVLLFVLTNPHETNTPMTQEQITITGETEAIGNPQKNREWQLWLTVPENNMDMCSPDTHYLFEASSLFHHPALSSMPPSLAAFNPCMYIFRTIGLTKDQILQSNQLITFFSVAANWVFCARLLGSKQPSTSYGQTFPAEELVIVVKTFPCNYNPMEPRNLGNSSK